MFLKEKFTPRGMLMLRNLEDRLLVVSGLSKLVFEVSTFFVLNYSFDELFFR